MGKVKFKRCRQCEGCRAPACKQCSKCKNKKACVNKKCTMEVGDQEEKENENEGAGEETENTSEKENENLGGGEETENTSEMLSILAIQFKECLDEDQLVETMEMLLHLDLSPSSLRTEEGNCVGRVARNLRGTNGEVGLLAERLITKWRNLGWSGWSQFLNISPEDNSEENLNHNSDEDELSDQNDDSIINCEDEENLNHSDVERDLNILITTNKANENHSSALGQNNNEKSQKNGRAKLSEQKRMIEEKYNKLITKKEASYECKCGFLAETKARASRHVLLTCPLESQVKKPAKKKKKNKNKTIKCNLCEETTKTTNEMLEHRKSHPELLKLYKCRFEGCTSVLNNVKHLKEHMKTHQAREKLPCPCCKNKYSQIGGRNRHILQKHKNVLERIAQENDSVLRDLQLLNRTETTGELSEKDKRNAKRRLVGTLLENGDKLADEEGLEEWSYVDDEVDDSGNDGDGEGDASIFEQEEHLDGRVDEVSEKNFDQELQEESLDLIGGNEEEGHQEESLDLSGGNDDEESEVNPYIAYRERNLKEQKEMIKKLGFDCFKEVKPPKMKKLVPPKITLPTRRSKRLNDLCGDDESNLQAVLAPELCGFFNQAKPIPVREIRNLPKEMRTKPMPTAKVPSQDLLPPLPVKFYSCTPTSVSNQQYIQLDSPIKRIEEMKEDQSKKPRLETFQNDQFKAPYPEASFKNWREPVKDQSPLFCPSHNKNSTKSEDGFEENWSEHSIKDDCEPKFLLGMLNLHLKCQPFNKASKIENVEKINFSESKETETEIKYTFADPVNLEDDSESFVNDYKCKICQNYAAKDNKDLRRHTEKLHTEKNEQLMCGKFWCNEKFPTRYELNEHRKNCKEVECREDGCSFKLKWKHQVSPHKRWHLAEREKMNLL